LETSRNIKSTFIVLFLVGVFGLLSPAYSETYIGFGIGTTIPNDFSNINLGVAATTNYDDLNVHNSFAFEDRLRTPSMIVNSISTGKGMLFTSSG